MSGRTWLATALGLGLWIGLAGQAQAQESHKFEAKKLESAYHLPVYAPKGAVVGNEVIEDTNDVDRSKHAIYYVKGDIKKALEFFQKSMGAPKEKRVDDVTPPTYTFAKTDAEDPRIRRKVVVKMDTDSHQVQITLFVRTYNAPDDADE